jgi:hypothetical protein
MSRDSLEQRLRFGREKDKEIKRYNLHVGHRWRRGRDHLRSRDDLEQKWRGKKGFVEAYSRDIE